MPSIIIVLLTSSWSVRKTVSKVVIVVLSIVVIVALDSCQVNAINRIWLHNPFSPTVYVKRQAETPTHTGSHILNSANENVQSSCILINSIKGYIKWTTLAQYELDTYYKKIGWHTHNVYNDTAQTVSVLITGTCTITCNYISLLLKQACISSIDIRSSTGSLLQNNPL